MDAVGTADAVHSRESGVETDGAGAAGVERGVIEADSGGSDGTDDDGDAEGFGTAPLPDGG